MAVANGLAGTGEATPAAGTAAGAATTGLPRAAARVAKGSKGRAQGAGRRAQQLQHYTRSIPGPSSAKHSTPHSIVPGRKKPSTWKPPPPPSQNVFADIFVGVGPPKMLLRALFIPRVCKLPIGGKETCCISARYMHRMPHLVGAICPVATVYHWEKPRNAANKIPRMRSKVTVPAPIIAHVGRSAVEACGFGCSRGSRLTSSIS